MDHLYVTHSGSILNLDYISGILRENDTDGTVFMSGGGCIQVKGDLQLLIETYWNYERGKKSLSKDALPDYPKVP